MILRTAFYLVLFWGVCISVVEAAAPIPTLPIFTNKPHFRIPFRYNPVELRRMAAREIQLYASQDRGINWKKMQAVAPQTGRFTFQALVDGEYWFAVRTLDVHGRLHPPGDSIQAGLKVVVDTKAPELYLALRQTKPGWVQLTWTAIDDNLDVSQLRLHYQQHAAGDWKAVGMISQASGQTQWSIPEGGNVAVRGSVGDLAKNVGEARIQTTVSAVDETVPRPVVPDFSQPIAADSAISSGNTAMRLPLMLPNSTGRVDDSIAESSSTGVSSTLPASEQDLPDYEPPQLIHTHQPTNTRISTQRGPGSPWGTGGERSPQTDQGEKPAGRYRVVNSREFSVGYKIDDVGPSGVSAVEIFITKDTGRSWRKYGNDPDRQSPLRIKVYKEGTYGLTLRVHSGVGLASEPPQPGDQPQIVVIVDTTPPELQLRPLQQGQGIANNKILIQWVVADRNLDEKPISLHYAASQKGPWHTIVGAIENTGKYLWTVGRGTPSKLYIRIKAQDAAGNSESVQTSYPVLVDLARPTARIVDIEPDGGASGLQ